MTPDIKKILEIIDYLDSFDQAPFDFLFQHYEIVVAMYIYETKNRVVKIRNPTSIEEANKLLIAYGYASTYFLNKYN